MYKIGIVGAGIISGQHKTAVLKHNECELCAICDIDILKAQELAEGTDANVYTDYKEMAEKEVLDAVILNLPHFLHRDVTVYFLEKKINVLVEKPMALNAKECEEMGEAEKASGAILAIGHLQRYFDCYRELKKIIDEEHLGKLCQITEVRNINYFANRPAWFLEKAKAGGGIVMNYCAHTLDKLFYLIGSDVEKIYANVDNKLNSADIEAQAQVLLKMKNGVSASLSYCGSRINYMYETLFYFTDGVAKVENGKYLSVIVKGKEERLDLNYEKVAIEDQFNEFVKLLNGEEADIVRTPYAKKIIEIIEEILK